MARHRSPYAYAIALPAREEEERIVACLQACHQAMARVPVPGLIVVVVNNSRDDTARRARSWARLTGAPVDVHEVSFPPALAHAGSARRAALDLARRCVDAQGVLMTTDADSQPRPGWVEANLAPLRSGRAGLVCGVVVLDPVETAHLPDWVLQRGAMEDRYRRLALELTSLLDPDPLNPWPFHGQASGASLAMSAACYDRIGGAPVVACAEDRALVRRFLDHDLPVVYSDQACVVTSCRLRGRAPGGMADTIAGRVAGGAHICDETIEPAHMVWRRADLKARLRAAFNTPRQRNAVLAQAGLCAPTRRNCLSCAGFGAVWAFVEKASPLLVRRRLLWEDMMAQLPVLTALRNTADAARATAGAPSVPEMTV